MANMKSHWEQVYASKKANEVSWTQEIPQTSLNYICSFNLLKNASIIDIGGGDSKLVDFLIANGYHNVTVLDISEKSLEKARKRLGKKAKYVTWIVSDITEFKSKNTYDVWHDRATFHFLKSPDQISRYLKIARSSVKSFLTIGTFSQNGPQTCSGLGIKQYSEELLEKELANGFEKIKCITEDHTTPFQTIQSFLFCSFKRIHNTQDI